ncbi:hypothetical protein [Arthrobacter sp. HLT1-21]
MKSDRINPLQHPRAKRSLAAGAALVAVLGATGCSVTSEQATTIQYAASDGIVDEVGPLELRNIMIITSDEGEPGTILGTVFNPTDSAVQLTIEGDNETVDITVPAEGKWVFEDETTDDGVLDGISEIPGALVDLTFVVNSETAELRVPVLDGTLEEYREYVPGGYTPDPTPTPEETGEEEE